MRTPSRFCRKGHDISIVGRQHGGKGNCIACAKVYREGRADITLFQARLRKYGITREQYNTRFEKQKGCCAICGKHQSELKRPLCVDHNHETGIVRALLCGPCNTFLGWYENSKVTIYLLLIGGK